jgi:chromosome segregation ATPase
MLPTDPYAGQMISSVPAPAWMGASAIGGVIVMKTIDWFLNRRSNRAQENTLVAAADGTAKLIQQLNDRIVALEGRQADLEGRLNKETTERIEAQEKVSRLRQRITVLVSVMKHHKIEVPAEDTHE